MYWHVKQKFSGRLLDPYDTVISGSQLLRQLLLPEHTGSLTDVGPDQDEATSGNSKRIFKVHLASRYLHQRQ